jgi:hypothetical protein
VLVRPGVGVTGCGCERVWGRQGVGVTGCW